jgi:hypothetical protein
VGVTIEERLLEVTARAEAAEKSVSKLIAEIDAAEKDRATAEAAERLARADAEVTRTQNAILVIERDEAVLRAARAERALAEAVAGRS